MTKLIGFLAFILIKSLSWTYRFEFINKKSLSQDDQYIFALWHQNLIGAITSQKDKHSVIVSSSKDGEYIAIPLSLLGHKPVRGSSTRGGASAVKAMLRLLKKIPAAITIDGPKGPKYSVKTGIFDIARLSQKPIIPLAVYPEKCWTFKKSWDEFRFPKPFSKLFVFYGEPIFISSKLSATEKKNLETQLRQALFDAEAKTVDVLKARK